MISCLFRGDSKTSSSFSDDELENYIFFFVVIYSQHPFCRAVCGEIMSHRKLRSVAGNEFPSRCPRRGAEYRVFMRQKLANIWWLNGVLYTQKHTCGISGEGCISIESRVLPGVSPWCAFTTVNMATGHTYVLLNQMSDEMRMKITKSARLAEWQKKTCKWKLELCLDLSAEYSPRTLEYE